MPLKSRPLTDPDQIEDIQLRLSQGRVIERVEWDAVLALAKRALELRVWCHQHAESLSVSAMQDGHRMACRSALAILHCDGDGGGK